MYRRPADFNTSRKTVEHLTPSALFQRPQEFILAFQLVELRTEGNR